MIKTFLKKLPGWLRTLLTIILAIALIYFILFLIPCRQINEFVSKENSTRFFDRNGKLLSVRALDEGLRREYYSIDDIPEELQKKFIEEEDKNFYYHFGVDLVSVVRAAKQNKESGKVVSGASTITMQLVRMIFPRTEKVSYKTKVKESLFAIYIEIKFSKKKILELYLNNVPFGHQIEGIGSASRSFYGVVPERLTSSQIDVLAQVPRRPELYAPAITYEYKTLCPHFINYVVNTYRKQNKKLPDEVVLSVDSELVEQIEKEIQAQLDLFMNSRIHNGSAVVINNHTGEIFAWVGNASFFDEEHGGQIDGVLVKNQPGSAMKPFLYALSLERGFEPTAILPDIQQDFGGSGVYVPFNFNNKYNGPVRFRIALASSLNIPAVYLLYHLGVDDYLKRLSQLGFKSLDDVRNSTGLSLALGSGEVTLLEMTRAFSVFPNDGQLLTTDIFYNRNYWTKEIYSLRARKNPEYIFTKKSRVYSADTTRIICDILSDKSARELGFGHSQIFDTSYQCIFKTGTSNQFQNIIAVGATTEFTVGVWMGNFEGETVIGKTGSSIPALVVRKILDELTSHYGAGNFKQPESYTKQDICVLSGMAPGSCCPAVAKEYVHVRDTGPKRNPCTWHYKDEANDRIKVRYPSEYQHWASERNVAGSSFVDESDLRITFPNNNATFFYDPSLPQESQILSIMAVGGKENKASLYIDDKFAGYASGSFEWSVPLVTGQHSVRIECGDETVESVYSVY